MFKMGIKWEYTRLTTNSHVFSTKFEPAQIFTRVYKLEFLLVWQANDVTSLPSSCTAFSQTFTVNSFRFFTWTTWSIQNGLTAAKYRGLGTRQVSFSLSYLATADMIHPCLSAGALHLQPVTEENITLPLLVIERCGGLMDSGLDFGSSSPHCVVFLGKTLNSYSASLSIQEYKWIPANC